MGTQVVSGEGDTRSLELTPNNFAVSPETQDADERKRLANEIQDSIRILADAEQAMINQVLKYKRDPDQIRADGLIKSQVEAMEIVALNMYRARQAGEALSLFSPGSLDRVNLETLTSVHTVLQVFTANR